ncbi:hypothetical protein DL240_05480 [Lujinxingia litoralis]|uniref:Type II secretion system protein GspG C-terminal domain-containing protein n=1 Tax=Lujinxingia litoralis TaxID=2211119 RepID=A0A328CCJ6_9DELT|nr:hypothetical protein [Lujinxingia litoralis]RAL23611.1 hypothetical protein DL240_05480 [Lujinxingia litoralis]
MSLSPGAVPPSPGRPSGLAVLVLHHSVTVVILVLFIGIGVWSYLTFQKTDFFVAVDRDNLQAQLSPPLLEAQRQRIDMALQVYARIHEHYPANLRELVDQGLLLPSDLYYPAGSELWAYQRDVDSFELTLILSQGDPASP